MHNVNPHHRIKTIVGIGSGQGRTYIILDHLGQMLCTDKRGTGRSLCRWVTAGEGFTNVYVALVSNVAGEIQIQCCFCVPIVGPLEPRQTFRNQKVRPSHRADVVKPPMDRGNIIVTQGSALLICHGALCAIAQGSRRERAVCKRQNARHSAVPSGVLSIWAP